MSDLLIKLETLLCWCELSHIMRAREQKREGESVSQKHSKLVVLNLQEQ